MHSLSLWKKETKDNFFVQNNWGIIIDLYSFVVIIQKWIKKEKGKIIKIKNL